MPTFCVHTTYITLVPFAIQKKMTQCYLVDHSTNWSRWKLKNKYHAQAGLSIRDGTRYFSPLKMIIGTSQFQRVFHKIFRKNVLYVSVSSEVLVHLKILKALHRYYMCIIILFQVGVVAFSNEPRSPLGCLGSKVNKATLENKKSLRDFLQNIKPKSKLIVYMLRPEYA